MASAFIQYALTRGEGVVKKGMLCTLAKKLKIVDHPLGFISLLSLMRLISNQQKAPLGCLTQLHTDFQPFQLAVYPVGWSIDRSLSHCEIVDSVKYMYLSSDLC